MKKEKKLAIKNNLSPFKLAYTASYSAIATKNKNTVKEIRPTISYDYLDTLRLLACFAVILLHYSGSYTYRFGIPTFDLGILYFTVTRWCVPIFLMITGALLLNKSYNIKSFYKKRFLRILPPFIFWSFIYIVFKLLNDKIKIGDVINMILVNGAEFHFWYIHLIIGLLLFLPLITIWTERL